MFTITESNLEIFGWVGLVFLLIGGLKLSRSTLSIGPYTSYGDTRRARGKKMALIGIALFMLVTAVKLDYPQITWLVRTHNPKIEEWEKWQKAVEEAKEAQRQIDIERQQRKYENDK